MHVSWQGHRLYVTVCPHQYVAMCERGALSTQVPLRSHACVCCVHWNFQAANSDHPDSAHANYAQLTLLVMLCTMLCIMLCVARAVAVRTAMYSGMHACMRFHLT